MGIDIIDNDIGIHAGPAGRTLREIEFDGYGMPVRIRHRIDLRHPCLQGDITDIQPGRDNHASFHAGHEAGGNLDLDLQLGCIRKQKQWHTRLHRITHLNQLLGNHAIKWRDGLGIAKLGVDLLDLGAGGYQLIACLFHLGAVGIEIGAPFNARGTPEPNMLFIGLLKFRINESMPPII